MALTRTRFSQANTAIAKIQDPITVLNSESSVANVDVGFLINRNQGIKANAALYWSETGSEFRTALTSASGVPDSNVTVSSYANVRAGSIFANISGSSDTANVYITGSLLPSANVTYDLGSSDSRFKTLWLSGSTIILGRESVSVDDIGTWTFTSGANTVTVGALTNFQGNGAIVGNLTVTNNLTLLGNTYTIPTQDLTVVDSIIELHTQANLAPLVADDGRDIGLKFHYFKIQDEHAFLGWANDTGYLEWYDSGREGVGNVFSGNTYGTIKSGAAYFVNTTPSTSTTTGALRVAGGVGIAGNLYIATTGDVSANIGTVKNNLATLDANVASYQILTNSNLATQTTNILNVVTNANTNTAAYLNSYTGNINAGNIIVNSNVYTSRLYTTDGLYWAGNGVAFSSGSTYGNTEVGAYLTTYNGNISAGNVINSANIITGNVVASGNIYGSLIPTAIFKTVYIGTTEVNLARGSGTLTVDNFNTTGYAAQANSAALATNATNTTVTSNISAGISYITFVNATSGNVSQNVGTALTFNPSTGNLRTYTAFVDTGLIVTSNVTTGGLVTTNGVFWANGNAWSSSSGIVYTASTAPPITGNVTGDQWYDTSADILYEYINDGTNKYWVDIVSAGNVTATAVTSIGNATLSGNISPLATTTYSIGSAGNTLKEVHTQALYENGARLASTGKAIAMAIVFGG